MILKSYSNLFKSYRIHLEVEAINMSSLTFISFVNISDRFVHKVLKLLNNFQYTNFGSKSGKPLFLTFLHFPLGLNYSPE